MQQSPAPNTDHLAFASALDRVLTRPGESHVWSPHSVGTVLGLLASGAQGTTLDELVSLLGTDPAAQLRALDTAVAPADGLDLATLNGLYLRQNQSIRPEFLERVRERPGAEVETADFEHDPEGVRTKTNAKVYDVTQGLVDELLPPGSVHPGTRLLLVNALWVKMLWTDPFEAANTRDRPFRTPRGKRKAATMHRTGRLPYAHTHGWSMVSLAGEHGLALDLLLPDEHQDTPAALTADALAALYRARSSQQVALDLPRFSVSTDVSLLDSLARLGVRELATDDARFQGISEQPLKVEAILHQSVLRVNEKGAEGAAATAATMVMGAVSPPRPVHFRVDRPFVFVLRRGEAVLFLGRITDPDDPGPAD